MLKKKKRERRRGKSGKLRVGADERSEEKDSAVPILGDLVVDLARNVFPESRHHLLLER